MVFTAESLDFDYENDSVISVMDSTNLLDAVVVLQWD